jgi:hypothetical protein
MKTLLKILTLFIAVGAVAGAVMMWTDPTGAGWGGAPMLFKKHPRACHATLVCGIVLMLWIVLEWWIWGFVALSDIFFVLGLIEAAVAFICIRKGCWYF